MVIQYINLWCINARLVNFFSCFQSKLIEYKERTTESQLFWACSLSRRLPLSLSTYLTEAKLLGVGLEAASDWIELYWSYPTNYFASKGSLSSLEDITEFASQYAFYQIVVNVWALCEAMVILKVRYILNTLLYYYSETNVFYRINSSVLCFYMFIYKFIFL